MQRLGSGRSKNTIDRLSRTKPRPFLHKFGVSSGAARTARTQLLDGAVLDFLSPWGDRVEVIEYAGIQITKARRVLHGTQIQLGKTKAATRGLAAKTIVPNGP